LENLVEWFQRLTRALSPAAEKYGRPKPKGALFVGPGGTGKSYSCQCGATAANIPMLETGNLEGSLVGETADRVKKAFRQARAVTPCMLRIDEIEKMLGGAGTDLSGSTQKMLGTLLTEMQEDKSGVFVVATCNDPTALSGPLLRRFDKIFWLDIPHLDECVQIFEVMKKKYKPLKNIAPDKLAKPASERKLTGAEIEKACIEAMDIAFNDGERPVEDDDILATIPEIQPVAEADAHNIKVWREWAKKVGAKNASKVRKVRWAGDKEAKGRRQVEID